jgi:hypothetical protein
MIIIRHLPVTFKPPKQGSASTPGDAGNNKNCLKRERHDAVPEIGRQLLGVPPYRCTALLDTILSSVFAFSCSTSPNIMTGAFLRCVVAFCDTHTLHSRAHILDDDPHRSHRSARWPPPRRPGKQLLVRRVRLSPVLFPLVLTEPLRDGVEHCDGLSVGTRFGIGFGICTHSLPSLHPLTLLNDFRAQGCFSSASSSQASSIVGGASLGSTFPTPTKTKRAS